MHSSRRSFRFPLTLILALCLGTGTALANEVNFDSHVVYYNVINTTFLSPEVARAYEVRRSSNRALANVAIMERGDSGMKPATAAVTGKVVNLNQQVRSLQFREIRDGDAIYHLAELPVRGGEVLDFRIHIAVEGRPEPMEVNFRQTFFAD
jgi:hypothetical protein